MSRWLPALVLFAGCLEPEPSALSRQGQIEGRLLLPEASRGDAYVFLFSASGDPRSLRSPLQASAVSDLRLASGDPRYVIAPVEPNPYRLGAFLDADRNFDADFDVLSQPGAGDRVAEELALNLQPGQKLEMDLPVETLLSQEPPAFRIEGAEGGVIEVLDQPTQLHSWVLVSEPVGALDPARLAFRVSLADENSDGIPEDLDGDGALDVWPRFFLHYLPRPGQEVVDEDGQEATVLLPLLFDPNPLLSALGRDPAKEVAVDRLQVVLFPQAQAVTYEPGQGRRVSPLPAIPVGAWEFLALARSGQFWRLPNALASEKAVRLGGPFAHQGVEVQVRRAPPPP